MPDLAEKLVPVARALLADDEDLTGCCVATWQKTLSGRMVAIAVAPTRILIQPVDRRFSPVGDRIPITRHDLARVRIGAGGGASATLPSLIMDAVSVAIDLTTTDGQRIKLMLMTSGGTVQREGLESLTAFLAPLE